MHKALVISPCLAPGLTSTCCCNTFEVKDNFYDGSIQKTFDNNFFLFDEAYKII